MSNIVELPGAQSSHVEAERAVLACMLLNPDAVKVSLAIIGDLGMDAFSVRAHEILYREIVRLHRAGVEADPISLIGSLADDEAEICGGCVYIAELLDCVPTSAHISYYAEIVRDAALRRMFSVGEAPK